MVTKHADALATANRMKVNKSLKQIAKINSLFPIRVSHVSVWAINRDASMRASQISTNIILSRTYARRFFALVDICRSTTIEPKIHSLLLNYLRMILNRRQCDILRDKRNDKSQEYSRKVPHTIDSFCALHIHRYHRMFDYWDLAWSRSHIRICRKRRGLAIWKRGFLQIEVFTCMSPSSLCSDGDTIPDIQHIHRHQCTSDHHWHHF